MIISVLLCPLESLKANESLYSELLEQIYNEQLTTSSQLKEDKQRHRIGNYFNSSMRLYISLHI